MATDMSAANESRLRYAQVLVELGDSGEAEREIAEILCTDPKNLTAFNLLAKIKHMRGELSQAIACWAQLHAQSPHNEIARTGLASILQLVKKPERTNDFLALGQDHLGRKPAAHAELENVFRLFLAHRPDEARAACERLASTYEHKDRELFKVVVLANAWIAELAGDLDGARQVLERLGMQRGFETDTDRVLALARVYERIGTAEYLAKAAHIFEFFERSFEKLSAIGRLAAIQQKLGNAQQAQEYQRRYLAAFRRRMHRPSIGDVANVAASRFLPLQRLKRLRPTRANAKAARAKRESAIAAYLGNDSRAARELLQSSGELLDTKYLANLDILEGEVDRGMAGLASALHQDPDDLRVLRELLDQGEALSRAPAFAALLRSDALRERMATQLEAAVRESPHDAGLWRNMATLRALLGHGSRAARCAQRAAALEGAAVRDAKTVGRVLAAAVFHFVGKSKGLIHQIWVDRAPVDSGRGGSLAMDDILGNLTGEMKQGIRNTFFSVREYARTRFPQQTADVLDYNYTYKVTKEDEPSGGLSAGLPTALAFLSVFLQRPVPQDVAYTGVLIADAHDVLIVRSVGEAEFKVKGAYNRNLRMVVLPAENRIDMSASAQIPAEVTEEVVRYVRTLDDALKLTFGEDIWLE